MSEFERRQFQAQKDQFFREHPQSPLSPRQKDRFTGLNYYPYDPSLAFELSLMPYENPTEILMQTNSNVLKPFVRLGKIEFVIEGMTAQLTVYQADYGLFLPFVDANAGRETYASGRYLEPEEGVANRLWVDFNFAYNPFCAYSEHYVCPITPSENRLSLAIRAGEKIPTGAWVSAG